MLITEEFLQSIGFSNEGHRFTKKIKDSSNEVLELYISKNSKDKWELYSHSKYLGTHVETEPFLDFIFTTIYRTGKKDLIESIHSALGIDLIINKLLDRM